MLLHMHDAECMNCTQNKPDAHTIKTMSNVLVCAELSFGFMCFCSANFNFLNLNCNDYFTLLRGASFEGKRENFI